MTDIDEITGMSRQDAALLRGAVKPYLRLPDAQVLQALAFHEAAHAVSGMASGMRLESLQLLVVAAGQHTGSTTWGPSAVACFDLAVQAAAGEIASVRFLQKGDMATAQNVLAVASGHDQELAIAAAARMGYQIVTVGPAPEGAATWDEVTAAAARAVDELWAQITAVARALLEAPGYRLTGHQVSALAGIEPCHCYPRCQHPAEPLARYVPARAASRV